MVDALTVCRRTFYGSSTSVRKNCIGVFFCVNLFNSITILCTETVHAYDIAVGHGLNMNLCHLIVVV